VRVATGDITLLTEGKSRNVGGVQFYGTNLFTERYMLARGLTP